MAVPALNLRVDCLSATREALSRLRLVKDSVFQRLSRRPHDSGLSDFIKSRERSVVKNLTEGFAFFYSDPSIRNCSALVCGLVAQLQIGVGDFRLRLLAIVGSAA